MPKLKLIPKGTVFAVPMPNGQFVGGIVTHSYDNRLLYLVFADKLFVDVPQVEEIVILVKDGKIIHREMSGDTGFRGGKWLIVGSVDKIPDNVRMLPLFYNTIYVERFDETICMKSIERYDHPPAGEFITRFGVTGALGVEKSLNAHLIQRLKYNHFKGHFEPEGSEFNEH